MNELDSEILCTQLLNRNLKKVEDENEADLLIFNTCSIRDLAEQKVLGKLGSYKKHKKDKIIGVCGCMPMTKKNLLQEYPHIDFVIGTNNLLSINEILDEILTKRVQINFTETDYEKNLESFFPERINKVKASISIIRGCNNFCSYCIVPQTRGREISRDYKTIIEEANYLANHGYKEITLLGQNVNSYGKDKPEWKILFHDLLYELDKINGIERIRFMTSHPKDITIDLMKAIRDLNKICEFVHFPLQSGSNEILNKMNRKYTSENYLEKVNLLREIVPDVSIGTDIIVGFPSETDENFEDTYNLFKKISYDVAFIFAYSPRENTLAYKFSDNVPKETKDARLQKLLNLYHEILEHKYKSQIGSIKEVLVERLNKDNLLLKGRTRKFEKVIFAGQPDLIGTLQKVKISSFNHQTLIGDIINK
jgi:tRNA-2-methylthio-N6-dimethylallyladenosine synthase